jgi:hypothetical protein
MGREKDAEYYSLKARGGKLSRYPRYNYHSNYAVRGVYGRLFKEFSYIWLILAIAFIFIAVFSIIKYLPNSTN